MATRNQSDAIRQELNGTLQQISGSFNFSYTSIAGFPRLLLHHDGSLYVLAAAGAILWLKPEYQIDGGAWTDSGWGPDGGKFTFPDGLDGTIPLQCNRPCFPTDYPAGTVINTRVMAKCSGSVVLCDSLLVPQAEAVKTWTQSDSHQWNDAEDDVVIPDIIFTLEVENIGSPAGTGAIWGEINKNRHFIDIEGNRFVWAGRRSTNIAQTVVGSVAEDGQVTFGTLSEDTLNSSSLSSDTYGVCYIGNNKFARFRNSSTGYTKGFAVWDCGASGLSASLVTDNNNGVTTISPSWRDGVLYSGGKVYVIGSPFAPDYDKCPLEVCDISNINGVTSNRVDAGSAFGTDRTVYYYSSSDDQGELQGKAAPGGAMWIAKTADEFDASSNSALEILTSNGLSANRYSCADADGDPLGLAVADDGIFAFAYRTTDEKIRVRVGKLTGLVPAFGDSFDIYNGATGQQLYPADIDVIGTGKFVFTVQNYTTNKQHYIAFESDGISVSCDDTFGTHAMLLEGDAPVMLAQSGYAGKLIVGNYGKSGSTDFPVVGSRYVSMISLLPDPEVLQSGSPVNVSVLLDETKYFAIESSATDTSLTVTLTGLTANVDLLVRAGLRPTLENNDGASNNSGTTDETVTVANSGETIWYIGVDGTEAGDCILTATLS